MAPALLADLVTTSTAVAATRSRSEKVALLASFLSTLGVPDEVACAVAFLTGEPRQGRIGVGWATLAAAAEVTAPAGEPSLTIGDLDAALSALSALTGAGSQAARSAALASLFGRATPDEAGFLRALLTGELRQGALAGVVTDAVARAAGVPLAAVRRAAMLAGDLPRVAVVAVADGVAGLEAVGLEPLRPVQPMLAGSSASVAEAMSSLPSPVSVEWKLDGARVQAHRVASAVRLFTRNLNEVTERLPGVVEVVRGLPCESVVLDGEVIGIGVDDDRPDPFQATMSRFGRHRGVDGPDDASEAAPELVVRFFDVLHLDGDDLIDEPLHVRLAALERVAGPWRVPGVVTADADEAETFAASALAAGHEGVMVKDASSTYEAGRRGASWRKVKPVLTLDLVVLAAEWGHGRRRGWLSNLHLGARGGDGSFVMVGKTFKGLTDALLTWQTEQLLAREERREGIAVVVRPDLVVEVALDGVQRSTRYPGGVTLRFARIKRYRDDKAPADADTIETVRSLLHARLAPPDEGGAATG